MLPFLTDTVIAAVFALIGVLVSQFVTRKNQQDSTKLAVLDATVKTLSARVDHLEKTLKDTEGERNTYMRLYLLFAEATMKFRLWAHRVRDVVPDGVELPEEPQVPAELEEHML